MTRRNKLSAGILLAVAALAAALVWVASGSGNRAPTVELTTLDGERFTLADLHGQPTLVTFWATTCVSCVEEIPHLKALYEDLHESGFEIIAVAMEYDPPEQVRAMVADRALPYRIVLDRDGRIAEAFGEIRLTPTTFLIGPDGEIRQRRLGMVDMERMRERLLEMVPGQSVARL